MTNKPIHPALLGLSVGDALGVPVEFRSRDYLLTSPLKTMFGYGTWHQPIGTWSDDSSLAFCLAESLVNEYNLQDIANKFIAWYKTGYWGAHGKVFDIGGATRLAIDKLIKVENPLNSGGTGEDDNGNGSIMRIIPLLFLIKDLSIEERYKIIREVSGITHGHFRSIFSCFIYLEFARNILLGDEENVAYTKMQFDVNKYIKNKDFNFHEIKLFDRILNKNIGRIKENLIYSSGYVLSTLEASLWCILKTNNYSDAVLKAVNLGSDTDTTACVTGGLAGLLYGSDAIPETWKNTLVGKEKIENLADRLHTKICFNMRRTLTIGDMHGADVALQQILERAKVTTEDTLIFLGDYVDGWSGSFNVIESLIELGEKQHCIFIKGNHDAWCEEWLQSGVGDRNWLFYGGQSTVKSYKNCDAKTKQKHLDFFNRCRGYYIDESNRLFIHAGFSSMHGPALETFPSNYNWDRTLWEVARTMDNRIPINSKLYPKRLKLFSEIFIGHTPTILYDIDVPMQAVNVWNIDTGAAFNGKLSILDIDTKQYWQSDNVNGLYPKEVGRINN